MKVVLVLSVLTAAIAACSGDDSYRCWNCGSDDLNYKKTVEVCGDIGKSMCYCYGVLRNFCQHAGSRSEF
ncbi:hypothetical protein PT974_04986 [Cladobotryum mycophilum]|uniref:Uncharacterized protein n=1 Tax=Cladobotryum mycophilum TaxID=491253 RepID=A0ABR0SQQ9_9HYPO